jgi:AMP deaminase
MDRSHVNAEQDEEIELGLDDGEEAVSAELQELYTSFQTCIELRDKYIALSCQRLEDNPNNYDGEFAPATGSTSTSASRPASPERSKNVPLPNMVNDGLPSLDDMEESDNSSRRAKPWKIYPPPPKPHWDPKDPFDAHRSSTVQQQSEFRFEDCEIPGEHPSVFELDSQGVYQVYENADIGRSTSRLFWVWTEDGLVYQINLRITSSIEFRISRNISKIWSTFLASFQMDLPNRMHTDA